MNLGAVGNHHSALWTRRQRQPLCWMRKERSRHEERSRDEMQRGPLDPTGLQTLALSCPQNPVGSRRHFCVLPIISPSCQCQL